MLQAPARHKVAPRAQSVTTQSLPAPIGGWNAKDAISGMDPRYAVQMDNLFPLTTEVMLRKGRIDWATGLPGATDTVAAYNSTTTSKLFAASGTGIYDVTSGGAVGAAVVTGLTSIRLQHVNYATSAGSFLYLVNGVDKPNFYDGTAWVKVDAASTPAITGVTTTLLIHVNIFKTRLFFIETNSMRCWYLPVNSIGGAANSLDLSSVFSKGGKLIQMGTWSLDAGVGMDDYAAFISSRGQVAIYRGTDPSDATKWLLVGVFDLGAPIGNRALAKFGGDLVTLTYDGIVPMSKLLQSATINNAQSLTYTIQQAISDAVEAFNANFGWEMEVFPTAGMLILNVPISSSLSHQYVMNTITGAWCRFKDWNATSWELYRDEIYFGTSTKVCKAWSGTSDQSTNINAECIQAFSYFGSPGRFKRFTAIRPIFQADNSPSIAVGLNVDFDLATQVAAPSVTPITTSVYDTATWDSGVWGGSLLPVKPWRTVAAAGYSAATHIVVASQGVDLRWDATDFIYESGALIG